MLKIDHTNVINVKRTKRINFCTQKWPITNLVSTGYISNVYFSELFVFCLELINILLILYTGVFVWMDGCLVLLRVKITKRIDET